MKQLRTWLAVVLITVSSTWVFSPAARADERTDARREFRQGMQMVADGQYDEGIKHLEKAYDILPHPNVLYNIALAHTYAGRPDAAVYYFERYKETAPTADAVEVDAIVARLRSASATPDQQQVAEQTPAQSSEQTRDELATLQAAAEEVRKVAEASNSDALRKRADELDASVKRLKERTGGTAVAQATPTDVKPSETGADQTKPTTATPAQPPPDLKVQNASNAGMYEEEIVSASRLAQSPLDAPNATAIITAQDIRLTGLTNLYDLLRRVAGMEVNSISPNQAEISIRGLNRRTSNKVLLLLDGRSLRQDFLGTSWGDFLPISIEDVERIEIIRGPASALYGADAMTGIINIITRAPGEGGSFAYGAGGNHNIGRAVASFNGKEGELSYHFGAGFDRKDVARTVVGPNRVDTVPLTNTPNTASSKAWGNGELRYGLGKKSLLTVGGNVVSGDQVVQGLSRLRQVSVYDATETQVYGSLTTPVGIRIGTWWNHMDAKAGLSSVTPYAIDIIANRGKQNVIDTDLSWSGQFKLLVPQTVTVGGGYRFKSIAFTWLDGDHTQHHFGAYLQDVIQLTKTLRLQIGARADRHPLLSSVQFSPRGSLVWRFLEGQSLRAEIGRAFRGPSFIESYLAFPNAAPLRGVSAWGMGNRHLAPESIVSFELGYQNQASDFFAFEANGYYNLVKNAILFTDLQRYSLTDFASGQTTNGKDLSSFDPNWNAYPVSSLNFTNERATYRQIGGELGARFFPVTGLDVYTNYSLNDTRPLHKNDVDPIRAKEQQTSLIKINSGIQYRANFGLDTSIDLHWFSKQVWVEQVTDLVQGVRFQTFNQPAFVMVNGRLGYRLFSDRLELGVVGTNLTLNTKRQHPFGQPMDTRVMGTAKIRF
jgi:outer membrane receptor for ferrienterochelin and colicin